MLLPSYPIPDYESDGIHLTAFSGLEFLLHLFDGSEDVLARLSLPPEDVLLRQVEAGRLLEERERLR